MAKEITIQSTFYPHEAQQKILLSPARFKIVIAGRRFGKSVLAVNCCTEKAVEKNNVKVWYCSPLYKQTKEIAWTLFQHYLPKELISKKNESELKITLINGSEIALKGTDNPDSLVGVGLHFVVLDEFPLMDESVWFKIVRPMLIDTRGEALFIGSPRGYNWAHKLYKQAEHDKDFARFHFKTTDNSAVHEIGEEVEKARLAATTELDQVTFRQEYEASFEVITGRPRFGIELIGQMFGVVKEPDKNGLLNVLHHPNPIAKYAIGVDTSEGLITGDNSTAVILDLMTYRVAAYYKGKIAPDQLASHLASWGKLYNTALIVVESNNHGLTTLNYLKDIYTNVYYRKQYDEKTDTWTDKLGYQTNPRTKPMLIAGLDEALRSGLKVEAREILEELQSYIIEEDGKTNASEGQHDDLVIGLALSVVGYNESNQKQGEAPKPEAMPNTAAWFMAQKKKKTGYAYTGQIKVGHL